MLERLLALIDEELPAAVALRHELHAAPELAHAEHATSAAIATALPIATRVAVGTGLLAALGSHDERAIAIRAELDGLPIGEESNVPFRSRNDAMHACGHDVHAAALVALLRAMDRLSDALPAPVLALFQPSEEAYPSGAELFVRGRALQPAPRAVVAAHVQPHLPWNALALDPGTINASSDVAEIVVEGAPAHGAYPHLGRDPVLALAQIVTSLHAEIGRRTDPTRPAVITVGAMHAGSAANAIPGHARAQAMLRAWTPGDRAALRALVRDVVSGVAGAHGCCGTVELTVGEPALDNDAAIVAGGRVLAERAGFSLAPAWRSCGADDFGFYKEIAPVAMAFVGLDGAPGFQAHPLHHPRFLPPDAAVGAVARAQAILYLAAAAEGIARGSATAGRDGAGER